MGRVTEVNTIGALLFGGLVASILYGVTSMQIITYYQRKHKDKLYTRIAVPVFWVLGSIDLGLIYHFLYYYLILNHGNFDSVTTKLPVQTLNIHFFVIAITQSTVRSLCAMRIHTLSRSWLPTLPIHILTLVDLGSNFALTIKGAHEQAAGIGHFGTGFNVMVCVNFASSTAGDALVALCLCYLLRRSRTGLKSTESMINILVAYVITTGLLTTLVQASALSVFLTSSKNFIYLAILTQVSKLYVNAYMALLNDRARIRNHSAFNQVSSPLHTVVSLIDFAPNRASDSRRISETSVARDELNFTGKKTVTHKTEAATGSDPLSGHTRPSGTNRDERTNYDDGFNNGTI
ncbi:hypothetical protein BDY19DRAFT_960081 [Irpex rosettiformis]|uniref:Uncharacterized protein n=1 Tax=Irpex rosettiformis TaxID=378272 RepID=A0ACB8TWP9_9APHY|nr:hypothetical protein BDY19DRAFT_960081 [Irpex rosettiformis]